jgi:pimeloyl-ACP methyl ester carboxylesterase
MGRMRVREGHATSADGTRLRYFVMGSGPRTWLSTPAMGAPLLAMSRLYEHLERELTIVTWDMRGFHGSAELARPDALRVEDHVADIEAVRRAVGVERYLLGGWSMGVPVSLEHARLASASLEGLILIAGPYERALGPVMPRARGGERLVLAALSGLPRASRLMNAASVALGGAPGLGKVARALGVVADNEEHFEQIVREFRHVDWGRYLDVARALHDYRASHLGAIELPTLIVAGERDRAAPLRVAQQMNEAIRGSSLFVVPRATHYLVSEYPSLIAARIARFVGELAPASA